VANRVSSLIEFGSLSRALALGCFFRHVDGHGNGQVVEQQIHAVLLLNHQRERLYVCVCVCVRVLLRVYVQIHAVLLLNHQREGLYVWVCVCVCVRV